MTVSRDASLLEARAATATLVVLPVSPWSERARWALDHHGIVYRTREHVPFLGERRLRKLVGRNGGPATVPVFIDGAVLLRDSWDIAVHADRTGAGPPLVPPDDEAAIRAWSNLFDRMAGHGRALVSAAMLASPAALDESLPPEVPRWARWLSRPVTRYGVRWFARKYALRLDDLAPHEAAMRETLTTLRQQLSQQRSRYVFGHFTYADIVAASFLQGVVPVSDDYIPLRPGTRAVWTREALAKEFPDLVQWRDALYRDHRRTRS